jgi:hypothetical protein
MKRFILRKVDKPTSANPYYVRYSVDHAATIRENCRTYIDDLDYSKDWVVEIKQYRKKRSNCQNAYIHAVPLKIISDHTGYTMDEMKEYLCGEFAGWETYERFDGVPQQRPIKTTSQMSTKEMTEFIDFMQWFGSSKLNLRIPSPNEWEGEY